MAGIESSMYSNERLSESLLKLSKDAIDDMHIDDKVKNMFKERLDKAVFEPEADAKPQRSEGLWV
jgi:hypothetical protein